MALTINPRMAVETTRELFSTLIELGADKQHLQSKSGINEVQLLRAESRFPVQRHLQLWQAGEVLLNQAELGLQIGSASNPYHRGIVGLVFAASPTLRAAIDNKINYTRILADHISLELAVSDHEFSVTYSILDGYFHHYEIERVFAGFLNWIRIFVGQTVYPSSVYVQHAKPRYDEVYHSIFGEQVQFDQPFNRIVFDAALLDHQNLAFNDYLYSILCARADKMLSSLGQQGDFSDSVRSTIAGRLCHGSFTAADIANTHNVSIRTFHRKLKELGQTYQQILDDVRKEMAISYLQDSSCSPQSVSYLIGYADERAFQRAFKRWTGYSPRQYLANDIANEILPLSKLA